MIPRDIILVLFLTVVIAKISYHVGAQDTATQINKALVPIETHLFGEGIPAQSDTTDGITGRLKSVEIRIKDE